MRDESIYPFNLNSVDTNYFLMFVKNIQTNRTTTMFFEQKKGEFISSKLTNREENVLINFRESGGCARPLRFPGERVSGTVTGRYLCTG